jgi:hypothetical protein
VFGDSSRPSEFYIPLFDGKISPNFFYGFLQPCNVYIIQNWLVVSTYPSEKYEFVGWDDEIPNIWKNNPNVPNHQPVYVVKNYDML